MVLPCWYGFGQRRGECDQGVDISDKEGGGLAEDAQNVEMSGQERTKDEHEVEVERPTDQSQRPVCMRKPPNRYDEWIRNGLQEMSDNLKMLEHKERKDKEQTKDAEQGKNTAWKLSILSMR